MANLYRRGLAGVPIDQVSVLFGHKSVKTTEKHYAQWVKARQQQLEASVQAAWPKPSGTTEQEATPEPARIEPITLPGEPQLVAAG